MKRCPVCQCAAFDDATTCFGCLHVFEPVAPEEIAGENAGGLGAESAPELVCPLELPDATAGVGHDAPKAISAAPAVAFAPEGPPFHPAMIDSLAAAVPPAFLIRIKPERERSGQVSWTCAVELVAPSGAAGQASVCEST